MPKICSLDIRGCRYSRLALRTTSKSPVNLKTFSIDIKKCSLKVLKTLALARDDAKSEILENGVIDQCLTYI